MAAAGTLAACSGWGPTQQSTGRYVYGTDSSGTRTAIAGSYLELQFPTGLAALPDGGSPRILKRGMLVYLCAAPTQPLRFLGFVQQPDGAINVDVRVLAWHPDGFDAAFRNYGTRPPTFTAFRILLGGGTLALGTPADTVAASQAIVPDCQHTVDSLNAASFRRGLTG